MNPLTHHVFVTNATEDTVSVFDGSTLLLLATVPTGNDPMGVAVDPGTQLCVRREPQKQQPDQHPGHVQGKAASPDSSDQCITVLASALAGAYLSPPSAKPARPNGAGKTTTISCCPPSTPPPAATQPSAGTR